MVALGWIERWGRENHIRGGYQETLAGDGCIHYVDCGDGFEVVYTSKFIKFYMLNICSLYVNYISVKLFPKIEKS